MKFFKVSKKTPQKTTTYIRYSDGPEGNTVVCIAKKENGEKKVLLKTGDTDGNETLYSRVHHIGDSGDSAREVFADAVVEKGFDEEIEPYEEEFAISREVFCAEMIRDVDPHCTPKYNRYYEEGDHPLIGPDFINDFRSWKSSYHYKNQTIFGFRINTMGLVDFPARDELPAQQKRIRGLGVCAVLLALLGKDDRGGENWGLIERHNHLQVVLIDFGRCLCKMMFSEKNNPENTYTNPFDIIKAVFEPYATADEPPLPQSFFESAHLKYEIFETIDKLYHMPASSLEKRADDNFKQFPLFKAAMLQDKRRGIEHLYNQFKDNKEYIATQYINEVLERTGASVKLSELDNESVGYVMSVYTYLNPSENPLKGELFFRQMMNIFSSEDLRETPRIAPQSM
ncbi:hypothetical protein [Legionella maioricensis]|uniref:Uncharacterized protein n=1 Tax=Legionella maioricensis TaxID=2896528 RepID=A0A9X2D2A2_9GAMM|nr:hypothetical protein [Legionella maioricensis]MCL9684447.1 hypothetical protein [Legionella maioricensis]MCL9688850.1 hypothetical protein [Legionella maioricensis]